MERIHLYRDFYKILNRTKVVSIDFTKWRTGYKYWPSANSGGGKGMTNVATLIPEVNPNQWKMLQRIVEEAIPEYLITNQTIHYKNVSAPPQPDDGPASMDVLNDEGKGYNQAIDQIRNNLRAKGLING